MHLFKTPLSSGETIHLITLSLILLMSGLLFSGMVFAATDDGGLLDF
jgi:hypothetical protein